MKIINTFRIAAMFMAYLLLSILLASAPATAGMIYTYTGNSFNSFSNTTNLGYKNISGSFKVSNALANNLVYREIGDSLTAWSFRDGENSFNSDMGSQIISFAVSTSITGEIFAWHIVLFSDLAGDYSTRLESSDTRDMSWFYNPLLDDGGYAKVENNKGNWVINEIMVGSTAPVPEPATMFLLGSGLLGLFGVRRKMRK
jgi:hypothetical protein